jgi:hypothetical protein
MIRLRLVGMTAFLSCLSPVAFAQTPVNHHHLPSRMVAQNEDIVTAEIDQDLDYITHLALMKGHLIVAKKLLQLNQPQDAEPHIGHPVDELYSNIDNLLQQRGVKEFKTTFNQLNSVMMVDPNNAKLDDLFQEAVNAVDQAMLVIPESKRQDPAFILTVIEHLLDTANEEYHAAIIEGKIVEVIEYQDSMGFVLYAQQLLENIAPQLMETKPYIHHIVDSSLTELTLAWTEVNPPAEATKSPQEVEQIINIIKLTSDLL